MDDAEYKRLCAQPDVMRRDHIRATATVLRERDAQFSARLSSLLAVGPLPKPPGHAAGPESDFFYLDLDPTDLDGVVSALGDIEAELADAGAPADRISLVAALLDRWNAADSSRPAV